MKEYEDMQTKEVIQQVGQLLRQIRNEQKLSLEELAQKTGVSKLTLGKIERGETNPTLAVIWKITKGLSIPLSRLMVVGEPVAVARCWRRICSRCRTSMASRNDVPLYERNGDGNAPCLFKGE